MTSANDKPSLWEISACLYHPWTMQKILRGTDREHATMSISGARNSEAQK